MGYKNVQNNEMNEMVFIYNRKNRYLHLAASSLYHFLLFFFILQLVNDFYRAV